MSVKKLLVTNRQAVRESFGKSEHDILTDIGIIKDWFKTQPHLPETPSDHMIEMFLVTNKFSIEMAKQKLDMYYTIRPLIPDIYENSNPRSPRMQNVHKMGAFILLPKLTDELYRVHLMKISGLPEDFDTYTFFTYQTNVGEVRLQHDLSVGDVFILDFEHLKMGHVVKITPTHVRKIMTISEKVFSSRIKAIHLVNYPSYVDTLISIGRAVLKPKIFARIHQHSSIEDLYKYVPRDILPKDYGGDELSIEELNELWKVCLKEHADRFDKLEQMKVKEELRPTPLQNDEILGYHGNFKKLDVD